MYIYHPIFANNINKDITTEIIEGTIYNDNITYPWTIFAYRLLSNRIDNRWAIASLQFSQGNRILNSLSQPIKRANDYIKHITENRFTLMYNSKTISSFVTIPVKWNQSEKIISINGKLDNNWYEYDNLGTSIISDRFRLSPKLLKAETYSIGDISSSNIAILDIGMEYSYQEYKTLLRNIENNEIEEFILLYPGRISIVISGDIKRIDPEIQAKIIICGLNENGSETIDEIKLYGAGPYITNSNFVSYKYIKLLNVDININNFSILIYGPLSETTNDTYSIKSLPFADYDGPFYSAFAKTQIDTMENNNEVSSIALQSYASVLESAAANGIADIENNMVIVLNNNTDGSLPNESYDIVSIDGFNHKIWAIKDSNKLCLIPFDIPEPPIGILNKIDKGNDVSFILETDFQYPIFGEIITITPKLITHRNMITSMSMKVWYISDVDNTTITSEDFDNVSFDAPIYEFTTVKPTWQFLMDTPGFYLFEASALYSNGKITKNYMPIYIPILTPISEFTITPPVEGTVIVEMYPTDDNKLVLLYDNFEAVTVITPYYLKYFFDNQKNTLLLTEKADIIDIETE